MKLLGCVSDIKGCMRMMLVFGHTALSCNAVTHRGAGVFQA